MRSTTGKRLFDLALAVPALLLSLPVQAVVALLVLHKLGRPVLFHQIRPGKDGRPFNLVKFRTMREPDSALGWADDRSRLTPFGATLRSTSLDELPTLWNVIRGDMSIVGPRPLLMQYLQRYTREQARRHEVKPGLTGLAQVSGRNSISWDQKLALDIEYVEGRSVWVDLRIIARTIRCVVKARDVAAPDHATMPEFLGSETSEKGRDEQLQVRRCERAGQS